MKRRNPATTGSRDADQRPPGDYEAANGRLLTGGPALRAVTLLVDFCSVTDGAFGDNQRRCRTRASQGSGGRRTRQGCGPTSGRVGARPLFIFRPARVSRVHRGPAMAATTADNVIASPPRKQHSHPSLKALARLPLVVKATLLSYMTGSTAGGGRDSGVVDVRQEERSGCLKPRRRLSDVQRRSLRTHWSGNRGVDGASYRYAGARRMNR